MTVPPISVTVPQAIIEEDAPDPVEAIPQADRASVEALVRWLGDEDVKKRVGALSALGSLGPKANASVPAVEKRLADEFGAVRISAALALWRITSKADKAVVALVDMLRRASLTGRVEAAMALGGMGPAAKGAIGALVEKVGEPERPEPARSDEIPFDDDAIEGAYIDLTPASAAAEALGRVGPEAKSALPALRKAAAGAKAEFMRDAAERAISRIEGRAK